MEKNYIARQTETKEQPLIEHLQNVGDLAKNFATDFDMGETAGFLGMIHDIGKYSDKFQERVRGANIRVDHSTAGGLEITNRMSKMPNASLLLANCIFGHHGGLLNNGTNADTDVRSVRSRQKSDIEVYSPYSSEVTLEDISQIFEKEASTKMTSLFSPAFLTRMLFSCLKDADCLDSEGFELGDIGRGRHDNVDILLEKLNTKLKGFTNNEGINKYRNDILSNCIEKSKGDRGIYSLTVPTGGGKTFASMAFALNHAAKHGMKRIIYVIPYTSIIEQNAEEFAKVLGDGNVLENHSNASYDNDGENTKNLFYLASENWDIPIVVTTNVQFFESLFSHKTSKTRKLHNMANSVIIFDEAQIK